MIGLTTKVFEGLYNAYLSRLYNVFVLEGGSRSSKTHSIIQFWIMWAWRSQGKSRRVVVARLKGTWLAGTVYKDFIDVLKNYALYDRRAENKTNKIYNLWGTEFWFVGLDDPQKIHGMQTDAFWINEAVEASKDSYDQLMQRCKGFAILDYNPSEEEHWIYDSVCKREKTWYSHSTMLDNPLIPRNAREQILSYEPTEENYRNGTVDKRKWLIYGLGKRAKIEGLVFEDFEIVKSIPATAKLYQGLDFGYTNDPTALENVGVWKGENSLYIDEICYKTHMTTANIITTLKEENKGRKIWAESADPRLIDEIYHAGFNIHAVQKYKGSVTAGIDKMKSMKLHVTETSVNAIKELKNYTYQQDKTGKWLNEPIDDFNHCFAGETMIETIDGEKRIDNLTTNDIVLTSIGYKSVRKVFSNGRKEIFTFTLKSGIFTIQIRCTPDHKILTDTGWKKISEVQENEAIFLSRNLTERSITYTQESGISQRGQRDFIGLSGLITTVKYPKAITYTTKIPTRQITISRTWKSSLGKFTSVITHLKRSLWTKVNLLKEWITQENLRANGTGQIKAGNGIPKMAPDLQTRSRMCSSLANAVGSPLFRNQPDKTRFALITANPNSGETMDLTMSSGIANYAASRSQLTNIREYPFAVKYVLGSITKEPAGIENVYDIEVDDQHEYFANGLLVHNCIDGVRYVVLEEVLGRPAPNKKLASFLR